MASELPKLLRLKSVIAPGGPICVSRSTWWAGVRSGRFPAPVKLGPRITAWKADAIAELIENGVVRIKGSGLQVPVSPKGDRS